MKLLKKATLLGLAILILSCENETEVLIEENLSKNQKLNEQVKPNHGSNAEYYSSAKTSKAQKSEIVGLTYDHFSENEVLEFYSNEEVFSNFCASLQVEDFENPIVPTGWGYGNYGSYLDESSNFSFTSPGDIQPNVKFSSLLDNNELGWIWIYDSWAFTGAPDNQVLTSRNWIGYADDLVIDFVQDDVFLASFGLFPDSSQDITIEVYGESDLLGYSEVYGAYHGDFWGITSKEPIKKIVLKTSSIYRLGIDNLNFGNNLDSDCDGIINLYDKHPFSNTDPMLLLNCYLDIENMMTRDGTFMNDEIQEVIDLVNAMEDVSDRRRTSRFRYKMYLVVNYWWHKYKLIDSREKRQILNCVYSMSYPFNEVPN